MSPITTDTGTTITLARDSVNTLVILDNPAAPDDLRHAEVGRVISGAFQAIPFMTVALRPAVLRAIADLIEADASPVESR